MSGCSSEELLTLAAAVRSACIEAARTAYRDAAISGLCGEGAQEAALGAIEMLDLRGVVAGCSLPGA